MARFLGIVQGGRGAATRLGTPASGIRAQAQGWDVGVTVIGHDADGHDVFSIYANGGSNDSSGVLIGRVTLDDGVPTFKGAK